MQIELDIITKWSHDNGLVINSSKTKLMHIKPRHLPNHDVKIKFHTQECLHNTNLPNVDTCTTIIEMVKTFKYLGVYVDENFKWLTHIQDLRKKLRKAAYSLFHLSNCTPFTVLKQAYFSLAESYIRHGITAWGSSTYCTSLQQTQNQILKILLKNRQHNQQIQYNTIYVNTNNTHVNNNTNVNSNISVNNTHENNITQVNNNTWVNNNTHVNTHVHNISQVNNDIHADNNTNVNTTRSTRSTSIASKLQVLNIKSIYSSTLINEFYNDPTLLIPIDHTYNTRRRTEGRYQVERFRNNYGKNSLKVVLPTLLNKMPTNLLNIQNPYKRKKLLKSYFLNSQ